MRWFTKDAEPTAADARLLRDALLAVLKVSSTDTGLSELEALGDLEERLQRFPVPTGVVKHARGLQVRMVGRRDSAGEEIAEAVKAVVGALRLMARGDAQKSPVQWLATRIPGRIGAAQARHLAHDARRVGRQLQPLADRAEAADREVFRCLTQVGASLRRATGATQRMEEQLAELEKMLRDNDPEAIDALRRDLLARVEQLRGDAGVLRADLKTQERQTLDPVDLPGGSVLRIEVAAMSRLIALYGPATQHTVLRALRKHLGGTLRQGDRLEVHGEAFLILMPGCSEGDAEVVGKRLRAAIEQLRFTQGGSSFKVGLETSVSEGEDLEQVARKMAA